MKILLTAAESESQHKKRKLSKSTQHGLADAMHLRNNGQRGRNIIRNYNLSYLEANMMMPCCGPLLKSTNSRCKQMSLQMSSENDDASTTEIQKSALQQKVDSEVLRK